MEIVGVPLAASPTAAWLPAQKGEGKDARAADGAFAFVHVLAEMVGVLAWERVVCVRGQRGGVPARVRASA